MGDLKLCPFCGSYAEDVMRTGAVVCINCDASAKSAREWNARADADALTNLQAENARLREALEPFSIFAGVLFAQNFHRDDAVATIKGAHGQATLIFEAFLDARAALKQET